MNVEIPNRSTGIFHPSNQRGHSPLPVLFCCCPQFHKLSPGAQNFDLGLEDRNVWLGGVGRLSVGEGKAPSFVRSLPEGLKGAGDIWEVGQFGGQLSRTHCKFSYFFCLATLAFRGLTVSQGYSFPRKMS